MDTSDLIFGTCTSMCSQKERILREREGLLHRLEIDEKTKRSRRPKADTAKIIKCFKRSSAGVSVDDPSELRPGPVLLLTLRYLFTKVLTRKDISWSAIYEFTFDRIRAIRQDMTVQRLDVAMNIILLEPIVRFHIYAGERMCEEPTTEYVAKFNDQHLLECIKQLLTLYDERDCSDITAGDYAAMTEKFSRLMADDRRGEIEAIYLLLYLGNETALRRGLSLPAKYRKTPEVEKALRISLAWHLNNYVRALREINQLAPLFAMAALSNLRRIRRDSLKIMSSGFNCKNNAYSIGDLKTILLYDDIRKLAADCTLFGVKFDNDNIYFQKTHFNVTETLAHPEKHFTDSTLDKLLPDILFK